MKSKLQAVAMILGVLAFRSSFADQYVIPSGSMEPTIQVGDHVLVNKAAYGVRIPFSPIELVRTGAPRRGDVIVFQDPRDPSIHLIKRLIGLPGDHIKVVDGIVEINGQILPLSPRDVTSVKQALLYTERVGEVSHLVKRLPLHARFRKQDFVVPDEKYFFLGDNRDNSADSRVWGFADRSALEGKALEVLYNVSWSGLVPNVSFDRTGTPL